MPDVALHVDGPEQLAACMTRCTYRRYQPVEEVPFSASGQNRLRDEAVVARDDSRCRKPEPLDSRRHNLTQRAENTVNGNY